MNPGFPIVILLFCCNILSAQVTITPGAQLYMSGNTQLTLENTDLVNNGSFFAGNGTVTLTGNAHSSIDGSAAIQFYELAINKTEQHSVLLKRMIGIDQQISFTEGFLDLNGFDADLGTTGILNDEHETSRIIGANGGQVLSRIALNHPANANPANLGAIITSGQDLGNVIIKRGHRSQMNGVGAGNSILRYYDIVPDNNAALNATLRFQYFDGELNGLTEGLLVFWKSSDNLHWKNEDYTTRSTSVNYVEKTELSSFSRLTLSSIDNPLPVHFILFNVECEGNSVAVNWKTAQEQNSSYYQIQRSMDAIHWIVIGQVAAAGNSTGDRSYVVKDDRPIPNSYYRIAQIDIDGGVRYTTVLASSCDRSDLFKVWPNPFSEMIFVNMIANDQSAARVKVFDNKGALVKTKTTVLLAGNNLLSLPMGEMARGIYLLVAEWDNGSKKKTVRVIKQ